MLIILLLTLYCAIILYSKYRKKADYILRSNKRARRMEQIIGSYSRALNTLQLDREVESVIDECRRDRYET